MKQVANKALALALTGCLGISSLSIAAEAPTIPTPLDESFEDTHREEKIDARSTLPDEQSEKRTRAAETKLTRAAKAMNFESGRIALFETFGGTPVLKVFEPLAYLIKTTVYAKDLSQLKVEKQTTVNYAIKKIFEEYYEGSSKRGFDKVFRVDSDAPTLNPIVDVYTKGIPTCWKLASYKELQQVTRNVSDTFQNEGIMPAQRKPLLIICVDGSSISLLHAPEDLAFLSQYFTLASFSDAEIRTFFLEQQDLMMRRSDDAYGSPIKEFVNDGWAGGMARGLNGGFKGFSSSHMGATIGENAVKAIGIAAIAAILARPINKLVKMYIDPQLPDWFKD